MRIGVVYDFAVHPGGGNLVMLNILSALQDAGFEVDLLTSNPKGLLESAELFDKAKQAQSVKVVQLNVPKFLRHPYTIAYIVRKAVKAGKHKLFILSDDVPKYLSHKKVVCYVNSYPHATRLIFNQYVGCRYKGTLKGRVAWWAHTRLFLKFYPAPGADIPTRWLFFANSRPTMQYVSKTFSVKNLHLLYPPAPSMRIYKFFKKSNVKKENIMVLLGKLEPEGKVEDLIRAMGTVREKLRLKLKLIGFCRHKAYMRRLISMINHYGLHDIVESLPNIPRSVVLDQLIRAKFIVNTHPYEEFGLAVVEGMAAGCIPIVRRGFTGPWVDIIQKGKYGLGFDSIEKLTSILEIAHERYDEFDVNAITSRALEFDEKYFRTRFLNAINSFF